MNLKTASTWKRAARSTSRPAPVLPATLPSARLRSAPWQSCWRTCTSRATSANSISNPTNLPCAAEPTWGRPPLHYFVAGAAFCLITQIARFAALYDVPLAEVQADVRAEFNAADKFVTDGGNGAFEQVTYAFTLRSSAP